MEADGGVKAPVTRLRRRMSVEQSEESKSPALNTPTKKRGGRRAAKPDLDLIDENNPDNTTKTTTKKAPVKEIIDSIDEKPVTPSRRSTRIKSNTSIVSDIALAVDSPRAKRAIRRTSQIGSDTEAPPTPVRQTRRTRKDSTSSIEKVEIQPSTKPTIQINEIIPEEPENNARKSTNSTDTNEKNTSTGNVRKSPRLKEKIKQNTSVIEKESSQVDHDEPTVETKNTSLNKSLETSIPKESENKDEETANIKISQKNRHSLLTSNLLKNLNTEAKTNNVHLNKSTSALETKRNGNKKRNRTKSWTIATVENENNFYSDNEGLRKKQTDGTKIPIVQLNKFNSGDGLNTSMDKGKVNKSKIKGNGNSFMEGDIDTSMTDVINKSINKKNNENKSLLNQSSNEKNNLNVTNKLFETEPSCDIQTIVYIDEDSDTNSVKVGIQNRHEHEDQCVPVIQHSDQLEKDISQFSVMSQKNDSIKANVSNNANLMNDSCEPMDVDETIPESSLIPEIKPNKIYSSSPSVLLDKSESKEKQLNKSKRNSSILLNLNKSENENKSTLILSQLKDSSSGDINNVTKSPQIKQSLLLKTTDDLNATQENDNNKRNLSLNYVTTSTPLQQKNLQKLGNINTSIIANNDTNNIKNKINLSRNDKTSDNVDNEISSEEETSQNNINEISKNKSNLNNSLNKTENNKEKSMSKNEKEKITSQTSKDSIDSTEENKSINNKINKMESNSSNSSKKSVIKSFPSTDSDDEMASNDESQESVNLIDDEAEDAGDSYESGDSQNENERQYLKENEILDKGETLTSDDDLSDDSDYEKDSFVVSSAEEDNELLDGTEDDLSMSDNELKMTKESKKKYDERKKKEQKKASREMYESRHKLNISNKSSSSEVGNSKRRKKQQLSSSESEDETEVKSKKKNHRMRLDSSHEVSLWENENGNKISDKKRKSLSESYCDDNAVNEKEITVCNESLKEIDPLTTHIKEEQKTPKKADSSIAFINTENDPNMESELTKTQTEFLDPLEDSMADEDSLSSDNENIIQNYDSILEGLNKTNNTKSKKCDISLNIDKKKDKKKNTAIIDELNLTQIKSAKKVKNNKQKQKESNTLTENKIIKPDIDRDSSPDSIDLHLLFSEDSNSSENIENKKNTSNTEEFIPLKRIEGKTDIRENTDMSNQADKLSNLDISYNKKNKKHKSKTATTSDNTNENDESFFIDTEGAIAQCNNSLNKSSSKKNKKKLSLVNNDNLDEDNDEIKDKKDVSIAVNKSGANDNSDSDGPMDVPFKKENRNSKIQENLHEDRKDETDGASNKSVTKTPNSEKKKKKKLTESLNLEPTVKETDLNGSLSKNKKKKATDMINEESTQKDVPEQVVDESITKTPGSKKKKRMSQSEIQEQVPNAEDAPTDKSFSTPSNILKKKKQLIYSPESVQIEPKEELSLDVSKIKTPGSQKKKKLSLQSQDCEQSGDLHETKLNTSKIKTPGSQKKKNVTVSENEKEDFNIMTPGSAESKKTNSLFSSVESNLLTTAEEFNDSKNTKKRKRKSSQTTPEDTVLEDKLNTPKKLNESLVGSQKKKRKVSQNEEAVRNTEPILNENLGQSNVGKKKKLKNETHPKVQNTTTEVKTNKRKVRDDDDGNKIAKVAKENSFDTVHVPRLPTSILKQLDDKPKQLSTAKKLKLVSTTQFSVAEARRRRNKPSNYLEESVYINDDEYENKKQKKVLPKPKVLPFVPTVLTSASGYTTNFKVNVIPTEMKFVAQSNTISNFKEDFLFNKNIRRHGTYELYKRKRNIKISKF
ncbi:dentin sialophosphoprotein-like isoform X3 [Vanessa atalanta]|uniref:dentin sialophosphoprotein-like isoform X3 n=1 Tax=Vanessa atalanta TaxID=42275 RepID=UPI001FCCFE27|nr:dentin sialophosphoprotein-like isoform X3 [Vanessa atalanta]